MFHNFINSDMKPTICNKPSGNKCYPSSEHNLSKILKLSYEIIKTFDVWSDCKGLEGSIGYQIQNTRTGYYGRLCNVPIKEGKIKCLATWEAMNGQTCDGFNNAFCNVNGMNLTTLGLDVLLPLANKDDMPKRMDPLIKALNSRWRSKDGATGLVCEECGCSGWTEWTAWSTCYPSCGLSSSQQRSRQCFGDEKCEGNSEETQYCDVPLCDNFNTLCNQTAMLHRSSMEYWEKSVIYGDTYEFASAQTIESCFDECLLQQKCVAAHFVAQEIVS